MDDHLLLVEAPAAGLRLAVCVVPQLAREAARRHGLASGSASALAQALAGTLLLATTDQRAPLEARVDVQLECVGPLRGLLVDADGSGAVRGLVRVRSLDLAGVRVPAERTPGLVGPGVGLGDSLVRFDARPLLATGHDERAGLLSILRAYPGSDLHRTAFPFAGADLGAALTLFLRSERALGGEMALEVVSRAGDPLAAVVGVLLWPLSEDEEERARSLGKPMRQRVLHESLLRLGRDGASCNGHALAQELASALDLGPLQLTSELRPRFACRCSRERLVRALVTLGAAELRDMAGKDGGARATCDFCAASYRISAGELLELAGEGLA